MVVDCYQYCIHPALLCKRPCVYQCILHGVARACNSRVSRVAAAGSYFNKQRKLLKLEIKKVVIIGPESTGKSTLCKELAAHYNTVWCPEYAREYLLEKGMAYTYEDLTAIAKGQLALEEEVKSKAKESLLFVDTDMYVMKVWYEVAFQHCPTWILKEIAKSSCDLYLLCNTDLPWTKDSLREYPDLAMRQRLFYMYKDIMVNSGVAWTEISGKEGQRLQKAITTIDKIVDYK